MPFGSDKAIRQLVEIYQRGQQRLFQTIIDKETRGSESAFERAMLKDIDKILKELDEQSVEWAKQVIPKQYNISRTEAKDFFARIGESVDEEAFARVNQSAIKALQTNFLENIEDGLVYVRRNIRSTWRNAAAQITAEQMTTGEALQSAKMRMVRQLSQQGLSSFKDKAGKEWSLESYAEMSIRSISTEATNLGMENQIKQLGRDLVQISEHAGACEICVPLEGRVYSISGESDEFPSLDNAFDGQYHTIHPNCRHRLIPYVEDLDDNPQATKEKSNRPFDEEISEQKLRMYKQEQEYNRHKRREKQLKRQIEAEEDGDEIERLEGLLSNARSRRREIGKQRQADKFIIEE